MEFFWFALFTSIAVSLLVFALVEFVKRTFRLKNPKCEGCNLRTHTEPTEFYCSNCGNRDFPERYG